MMTDMGTLGWLAREAMRYGGLYLAGRGIGDEALWQGVGGALIALVGTGWSWWTRRGLKQAAGL